MKKGLLFIVFLGLLAQVYGQDVIWSDDFSNGLKDWTVNSSDCGTISGPLVGEWTLTRATVNGQELSSATGYISVGTEDMYIAKFTSGSNELYVQGRYALSNSTFQSNLTGETLSFDDNTISTENNDTVTVYFASLSTDQGNFDDLQYSVGIGNPTYTTTATTLEVTMGNSTFLYQKTSECGALWFWDKIGWYGNGALIFPEATALSETADNGTAMLNADFYTSGADFANLPDPPYPQYFSELISPAIDFSAVDAGVQLTFYQTVRILNEGDDAPATSLNQQLVASVSYSIDNGATWSGPLEINVDLPTNDLVEEGITSVPIPNDVLGQPQVRIRFTFSGDFYYWVIDDIEITGRIAYDMQVNTNFLGIYPNVITPASQVDGTVFVGDIQNNGGATAEDVQLNLTISNDQTGTVVYNSTINYGAITPDSLAENSLFPDRLEPSAIESDLMNTASGFASYTGVYTVSHNNSDGNMANDTASFQFYILDTLFARCDLINGCNVRGVAPASDNSYTFGNSYYTPNGDGFFARSMAFAVSNPEELVGRSVSILLYEWAGDANRNQAAEPEEYGGLPIAFNSYTFDGTEVNQLIDIPLFSFADPTGGPALKDDTHYIIAVQYFTDGDQDMLTLVTDDNDYLATVFANDSLDTPRHMGMLAVGQEEAPTFGNINAFTANSDLSPLIHLHIGDNNDLSRPPLTTPTSTESVLSEENLINLYPNPVEDAIQLKVELVETSERVDIQIFDQTGRVLQQQRFDNVRNDNISFNVDDLATGVYLMKVTTDLGSRPIKFVKK